MKAVVMGAPGEVALEERVEPVAGPGEVLLRVRRIGLCGTDLNSYRGLNPLITYPRVPGHEIAATIVKLGDGNLPGLAVGTNVAVSPYTSCGNCASCRKGKPNACQFNRTLGVQRDGGLEEYIVAPGSALHAASLNLEELCLVEPLAVGAHAVARAGIQSGETVAVVGCGGVGLGAIAAAKSRGATVIALDVDDAKLDVAESAGATHKIRSAGDRSFEQLRQLTDGHGPDVVIEAVGSPETFRAAVDIVSFAGRVVYIGYAKAPVTYETRLFVQKELQILGSRNALPEDFKNVIGILERKEFPVRKTISVTVGLDEVPETFASWSATPARFTKIIVNLDKLS